MNCGLFGKLPAKRDFIALNAPSAFLAIYEKWLQGGLTASRLELGPRWQGAYLNAPIWRFWLGSAHAGQTVAGAFMPSVDGVGRYFPLTVFAATGTAIPPPELDPQDGWFEAVEAFLLRALEPEASFEAVAGRLAALPLPNDQHLAAPPADMVRLSDGTIASAAISSGFPERLAALRIEDHARAYAHACYLWTIGGPNFEPLALTGQALPDPYLFAGLLTGRFDAHIPNTPGHEGDVMRAKP
ncbi:type VI secretion-associated protein [Bosea thiooxidans]|uniref:Type VI secretion system protein ImpM n=1 Tax=Bosea thiooxidans TaxID=53254 RepID=A0A0Q3I192_9HYPH|nr:type VI secretion system-associated protein TagF [Bosea thiooxidans]KQK28533.1 type VI secretion-associated protein [Bosea thiooxidans]SKC13311.1 type VI secretion system protein ImpM [Bosea thiooxidans]